MITFNNKLNSTITTIYKRTYIPGFKSRTENNNDKFEKQPTIKNINMLIKNPHTLSNSSGNVTIDMSKPQIIKLKNNDIKKYADRILTLDYNPNRFGYLKDKLTKQPIKTLVLIGKDDKSTTTSYHFMSENLEKEYGYIEISDNFDEKKLEYLHLILGEIYGNYPELGICGPRIIIEYLENLDKTNIGGIGALGDKISIVHCLKNNIKPVIVSLADKDSHVAHYLRGKRFMPIDEESGIHNYYMKKYGTADVNEIIKNLIINNNKHERISTKSWPIIPMYMPQSRIAEIMNSLKDSKGLLC